MGDYDKDTAFMGERGPYFWKVFFLLNLLCISTGLSGLYIVFAAASPPHHCQIPEGNLSEAWRQASIPTQEVDGQVRQSKCQRYRLDVIRNLSALGYDPRDVNLTDIERERCVDGWTYSKDIYQSTIVTEWNLVCDDEWRVPLASSTLYMGFLFGSLVSGQLSDRFGRKKVLFVALTTQLLFLLFQSFSTSWLVFCTMHFFVGASQVALYVTTFVLGTEVLSKSMRVLFTTLGCFLHYCIGYMLLPLIAFGIREWRTFLRVLAGATIVYFPLWWFITESPRWLISQGRLKEAEAIVQEAAKKNNVTAPDVIFTDIEVETTPSKTRKYTILDVVKNRNVLLTTFMCLLLWMAINIGYFGLSLNTSNLSGNPFLNCFLSAATEVPAYIVSTLLLRSCQRRVLLSVFLMTGGGFLLFIQLIPKSLHTLAVAFEMAGKFGFTMAFTVVYIYTAEIYPTVLRNLGMGICSAAARVGSITAPYVIFLGSFNKYLPYILMGSLTMGSAIVNVFLPETYGKDLPEALEQMQKCKGLRKGNEDKLDCGKNSIALKETML